MSEVEAGLVTRESLAHGEACLGHLQWLALGSHCRPQLLDVLLLVPQLLKNGIRGYSSKSLVTWNVMACLVGHE